MKTFKLEPGETLEVLPPQTSALIKLKHYVVRLRHDLGIILVVAQAADHRAAITSVLEAAAAPRSAVISVQKIKWRGTAQPGTKLKALKFEEK